MIRTIIIIIIEEDLRKIDNILYDEGIALVGYFVIIFFISKRLILLFLVSAINFGFLLIKIIY